jgi:hypothetical protein
VTIERSEIACALGPAATQSVGIELREGAQATISGCSIKNAGIGLCAKGAGSRLAAQATKVTMDREDAAGQSWGLHATAGASAAVENVEFRNQTVGIVVDAGAALSAADCRFSNHEIGVYAEGADTRFEMQGCGIAKSGTAIAANGAPDAGLANCTLEYKGAAVQLASAGMRLHKCTRIAAEIDSGVAFEVDGGSSLSLSECRVFRGAAAVRAQPGARIEMLQSELWNFLDAAIMAPKDTSVDLRQCKIYRCLSALDSGGKATVYECKISDHRASGIVSYGSIEVISSDLYDNAKHGLELSRGAEGGLRNCQIFRNNAAGILADHARVDVHACEMGQNNGPAVLASGAGRASVTSCDLRGSFDSTPLLGQYGGDVRGRDNRTPPKIDLPEHEQPTSGQNMRSISVGIFAKYGEAIHTVQEFVRSVQVSNGYQLEGTRQSEDGRSVTHILSKRYAAVVPLKPLTGAARLQATLKSNDWESSNENVPYELKITLTVAQSEAVRDIDRVLVEAVDQEWIDPQNATRKGIGTYYAAPSHLYQPGGGLGMKIVSALPAQFPYREPKG